MADNRSQWGIVNTVMIILRGVEFLDELNDCYLLRRMTLVKFHDIAVIVCTFYFR
jgi:hypothetical protein